jgi:hypothetical protein
MDDLDRFFQIFLESLDEIDESYWVTIYENFQGLNAYLKYRGKFNGQNFERYNERVFCYELYHQLRNKLDAEGKDFLGNTTLQGELKKIQVEQFVRKLGLRQLTEEFIPDFVMHSSGSAKEHHFVIEVKCDPDVSKEEILSDLKKIDEFIDKFNYKRGIFLTTNANPENLASRIGKIFDEIGKLNFSQICLVSKPSRYEKNLVWNWKKGGWEEVVS